MYLKNKKVFQAVSLSIILYTSTASANTFINAYLLKSNNSVQDDNKEIEAPTLSRWNRWVDNTEIRSSDNDISDNKNQSYALRIRLKNAKQKSAEHKLLDLASRRGKAERDVYRLNILRKSYLDVINLIQLKQKLSSLHQQLDNVAMEASAYTQQVTSDVFSPSKVQKADIDADQVSSLIQTTQQSLNRSLALIGVPANRQKSAQQLLNYPQWLVSITDMIQIVDKDTLLKNHPSLQRLELASNIAKKQVQHEKAKKSAAVSLFELKYDVDKDAYGATIGVRIPLGKNNFDTLMRNNSYQQTQLAWELKLQSIKDELQASNLRIHDYYDQYKQEAHLLNLLNERLKRMRNSENPELILSLKKEKQQRQAINQSTHLKIVREYINFLFISGRLAETPLRNWLQKGTPRIRG